MKRIIIFISILSVLFTGCSFDSNNKTDNIDDIVVVENQSDQTTDDSDCVIESEITTEIVEDETSDIPQNIYFSQMMFSKLPEEVSIDIQEYYIYQSGVINNQDYFFIIDLSAWEQYTTPYQIVELSRLFWQCYPKMFERFSDLSDPPTNVTLAIENDGYEVASASDHVIHLHDKWLYENETDFDCITHELAHVIQNGWDESYLESSEYIERFADCCRYEYAMDNGFYNDEIWELQTVETEVNRFESVRFFVWLDYMYSNETVDIMRNFMNVCRNMYYDSDDWNSAWNEIFSGTEISNKTIDEVWGMYESSDFAYYPSYSQPYYSSELLEKYHIRDKNNELNS